MTLRRANEKREIKSLSWRDNHFAFLLPVSLECPQTSLLSVSENRFLRLMPSLVTDEASPVKSQLVRRREPQEPIRGERRRGVEGICQFVLLEIGCYSCREDRSATYLTHGAWWPNKKAVRDAWMESRACYAGRPEKEEVPWKMKCCDTKSYGSLAFEKTLLWYDVTSDENHRPQKANSDNLAR